MTSEELKERTKAYALSIILFVEHLPNTKAGNVLGKQLLRAATSVGANYRAACKARSRADFISKVTICEEEADETIYWLELIEGAKLEKKETIALLVQEAKELTAIFTASGKTAKHNRQ